MRKRQRTASLSSSYPCLKCSRSRPSERETGRRDRIFFTRVLALVSASRQILREKSSMDFLPRGSRKGSDRDREKRVHAK